MVVVTLFFDTVHFHVARVHQFHFGGVLLATAAAATTGSFTRMRVMVVLEVSVVLMLLL